MIYNGDKHLAQELIGKTLDGLEFGCNEDGARTVELGQKITDARIGYDGEDVQIYLTLENDDEVAVYLNEDISLS